MPASRRTKTVLIVIAAIVISVTTVVAFVFYRAMVKFGVEDRIHSTFYPVLSALDDYDHDHSLQSQDSRPSQYRNNRMRMNTAIEPNRITAKSHFVGIFGRRYRIVSSMIQNPPNPSKQKPHIIPPSRGNPAKKKMTACSINASRTASR